MSPIRMALSGLLNFDGGKQEGSAYVGVPVCCIVWHATGLQISPAGVSSISGFRTFRGIVYQVPLLCMSAPFPEAWRCLDWQSGGIRWCGLDERRETHPGT